MSDKKPKPPRPPAPNLPAKKPAPTQATKKRTLPSTTISMRYNPLLASDDDDDLDDDSSKGISFITTKGSSAPLAKSTSLEGVSNPAKTETKPSRQEELKESILQSMDVNYGKRREDVPPVNKPVTKVKEEALKAQPASPMSNEAEKKAMMANDSAVRKPDKPTTITGLMKVPNAVLTEDEEASVLPADSEEAISDPLTFLDKVMEEQLEKEALEEEAELGKKKQNKPSVNRIGLATHKRARSLDCDTYNDRPEPERDTLEIDPCYYTVPAPSELPDEAIIPRPLSSGSPHVRHRKIPAKNVSVSLSGLLRKDDDEEEEKEASVSTQSSRSTLDSPDGGKQDVITENELQNKSPSTPGTKEEVAEVIPQIQKEKGDLAVKEEPQKPPDSPPIFFLAILSLCLFVYFQFPLSRYMMGFFAGMALMFYSMLFAIWLSAGTMSRDRRPADRTWDEEDYSMLLVIPGAPQSASVFRSKEQKRVMHKGWMNELPMTYDPDNYHTSQTQSVFVRLDGYSLRLSRPKHNISRRAMFNEPTIHKVEFVHQRHYDMRGSKVYLLPDGLVKKRLWSKKYPICIELPKKIVCEERKESPDTNDDTDAKSMGFDYIKKEECDDRFLFLFTRTSRDKEEWYWKFDTAAKFDKLERGRRPIPTLNKDVYLIGGELTKEDGSQHSARADPDDIAAKKGTIDFYRFIAKVLPKEKDPKEAVVSQGVNVKAGNVTYASPARRQPKPEINSLGAPPVDWINALVGRFFWDFLREESWADLVKKKLQKKLSKLKVPYFIEELKITDIDLGLNAPQLRRVSKPYLDGRGLWVDMDMAYGGSCMLSMTTKVNLWRLGKGEKYDREMTEISPVEKETKEKERQAKRQQASPEMKTTGYEYEKPRTPSLAALDSEEEDSAESSDEETDETFVSPESTTPSAEAEPSKSTGKLMRIVNKIASSKYFQSATQNKYIKRAMDEVSNTPVELTVEVKRLAGPLCVNIPPPPTDRFWYGFRGKPSLWLSAKPKLGTRQFNFTHITDYIERKLETEFQKVFVLPNMDDVPLPIMMTSKELEKTLFKASKDKTDVD
ncbi:testis-expressed protein 2-like isoform X2 [Acanthaster planci]|uniref:Testis-expressed protein 2-like isoform X2 n=1 Tax=Acanthaster planci TaxID=133434 RepID=A0A8B7ZTJ0_ACAPL|nr:testis-expressed protein 2-like isoform X2 [Acanthaster planci]